MALSQRLDLRQTQSLVMTPQLQQAIKLLQLSNLELTEFVDRELEQNPLLERDEPEGDVAPEPPLPSDDGALRSLDQTSTPEFSGDDRQLWQAESGSEGEGAADIGGDPDALPAARTGSGNDGLPTLEETLSQGITLREHLIGQANCDLEDAADRLIAYALIDLMDEAGYLPADLTDTASLLGASMEQVEAVVAKVHRFEPTGVLARNLAECLAIQLRERGRYDPCMERLLANLPLLAARDLPGLMRACAVDAEDLSEMIAEVKSLDPKPGLAFEGAAATPVVPDILMRTLPDGQFVIELNAETLPRVLVNTPYYAQVSKTLSQKSDKEFLAERFNSANWLIKSLHQRATTILKVATEIVRQQDAFFLYGVAHLRPLILRDISEAIGMHESTVSRVTSNKYMTTPRGLFELKYFFTSSIPAANGAESHSAEAVKFRIRSLINAEGVSETLSDDRLVEILHGQGVDIARRTVAKYREAMRIPSSVLRRREKTLRY